MTFSPHLLIRASAGSGKTHQLTSRFIGLLVAGEDPSGILAVTFTRLAAGEIMERVLIRMLQAIGNKESLEQLQQSLESVGFSRPTSDEVGAALRRLLEKLHLCTVSTLDAFFARIATAHTFECGLTPGWTILDNTQLDAVQTGAIQNLLSNGTDADARILMHRLNRGKSSSQVADQLQEIVSFGHAKYLEFPRDAWHNPEPIPAPPQADLDQARQLLQSVECPKTKTGTDHKNWRKALDGLSYWFEDPQRFDPLDLFESGIGKAVLAGQDRFHGVPISGDLFTVMEYVQAVARAQISRIIRTQNEATGELLSRFDHFRSLGLRARGGVAFQDIPQVLVIAGVLASANTILYRLDATTRHLLLDEFQDTSYLQFAAIRPLVEEIASDSAGGRSIFCVGDPKQAIYGWRGGRAEVLDHLEQYLLPGSDQTLEASYRSSPEILEAVNSVFGTLPSADWLVADRDAVSSWCENFHDHFTATGGPGDTPGHVVLKVAQHHEDRTREAAPYIDAIEEVERVRGIAPEATIAVLVRKNQNIARLVAALRERGIDASEEGGNPLVDSPAVGRIVALLELVEHPGDATMRLAVASSPLPDIAAKIGGFPAADWLQREVAVEVAETLRNRIHQQGISDAIAGLVSELAQSCGPEDRTRLQQMMEQIRIHDARGSRLENLIQHLRQHRLASPTGSTVQVMTVHQAKGLGRDVVILPELAAGWFKVLPKLLERSQVDDTTDSKLISRYVAEAHRTLLGCPYPEMHREVRRSQLQESLSVLYVAMTRARHSLTMIIPSEKKLTEASSAHLLWKTLGQEGSLTAGTILHEQGDPLSIKGVQGKQHQPAKEVKIPKLTGRAKAASKTPSHSTSFFTTDDSFRARSMGTLAHLAMEQIEWGAEEPDQLREVMLKEEPRIQHFFDESIEIVRHALQQECVKDLFDLQSARNRLGCQEGDEIVAEREIPFSCEMDGALFSGIIDRLVLRFHDQLPVAAEVIDFKTDRIAGDAVETASRHREQLESYRQAVNTIWKIDPQQIDLKVVLIRSGDIVSL